MIIVSLVALFGADATAGLIKEFMCTILTLPTNNFSLQTWKSEIWHYPKCEQDQACLVLYNLGLLINLEDSFLIC
jgi:hypothetical protein